MKTNEGGAGFGTIGKERSKLLTAVVVAAVVLACCAMLLPVDAEDTAPEITYTEISPENFLALADDDGVISLEDNYRLTGPVVLTENIKIVTNGKSMITSGDMFRIGADGIDVEIDATAGGSLTAGDSDLSSIIWGNHLEANVTVIGGVYTSDEPFVICGNNKAEGLTSFSIKDATVNGNTAGIWLSYGSIEKATIENCTVSGSVAMYIATVKEATITGCNVTGETNGIEVKAGDVDITGCTISTKEFLVDDTVGMSQNGGSAAPIAINNGYCSSAQVTYVDVTISDTTATCEAEGYTPVVVTSYYDDSVEGNIKQSDCDISVTWEGASNSDVTFCPTKADATMTVNGFVAVDTAERLNAAVENGSNVVLAGDITATVEIEVNQNIIIDLNGFTLDGGTASGTPAIRNYGTTTIIDSSDDQSGVIQRSDASGGSYYVIDNHGTLNITGGTITNNSGSPDKWQGSSLIRNIGTSADSNATLNISGGHIYQANFIAVKNDDFGVLNITGGLIEAGEAIGGNAGASAVQNWHIADITGGTINGPVMSCVWGTGADDNTYGDSSITISGTAVINGALEASYDTSNLCATKASITINDGAKVTASGVYIAKGSINGTFELLDGGKIRILDNGTLTGTIIGPGGNTLTVINLSSDEETTIVAGSFVIDGSWIGEMTVSGDDIVITGTLSEGAKITVKSQADGDPTNITWRDFDQNGASIVYQDAEGGEAEPSEVSNQIYENATIGGVTIDTTYPEGGYVYDGEAQPLPTITVSVTEGQVSTSGFLQAAEEGAQASFVAEDGLFYYWATSIEDATIWHDGATVDAAIDVGAYTVKYGYAVDGTIHVVECSWIVEKATLTITVDQDEVYDGQDMSYDITTDDVSGLGAGDSITGGTITTTGSDVKDYTVEGQDWTIDKLSTVNGISNYEIVISSVSLEITPRDLTIEFAAHDTYDGDEFAYTIDYPNSEVPAGELVINGLVDGESVTGTLTTNDSIAKVYTYNDGSITAEITVSSGNGNYNITYTGSLTIDKKDVTVSGATIADKVYDGSTSAVVTGVTFDGLVGEDSPAYNTDYTATAVFDDANAGTGKTLSVTVTMTMGSTVLNNYNLPTEATELDGFEISKAVISIASATVDGKVYDGTENWNVSAVSFTGLAGVESLVMGTDYTVSTAATWNANAGAAPNYLKYADVTVTLSEGLNYTFDEGSLTSTITNVATSISPIVLTEDMIHIDLADAENGISMTASVSNEGGLSPTGFTTSVTGPDSSTTVSGSNPYTITQSGTYTVSVSISGDSNWSGTDVTKEVEVELNTARFFTAATMEGGSPVYSGSAEQTVVGTQIVLPNANDVPEGYVLAGWIIGTDGTTVYTPGTYFDVPVSGVDLYAVYEKDDGTPVGPGPEPAAEPTVTIDMPDEFVIGVETEFSVSTTKGDTTGTVYVKGTGSFEGIPGVDYNIWYLEDQGGKWYAWDGATFGPSTGFPLSDATSKFKVQFINAGAYDLTVQIVTVDNGDVVCETAAVVNVPAENTLGYHIQNAVDFVYTDDPDDYNADAYTYKGILSSSAGAIVASYGYDYYEALIEDLQKNPASMSEKTRDIMNDFARYMGALYRSADGDVGRVSFNGTEYMWKADSDGAWLNGSNWRDADGKTLTEIVVQYIAQSQNTKVVMEVSSNGISAETLTYSVQFDDAPVIPEKVVPGITFDMPEFTAGQEGTFQVSFIANDYVGEMAVVKAIFGGDAGDITSVYYWNVNSKAWTIMTAEADGSYMYGGSGFPLMDATSTFKATIANAGVYTLNVEILVGGESIASKTATFVVGEPVQEPEVEKFTVSFIVNGESYGSAVSVEKGESILLPTPSVDGYVFNGWYAQGGSEADAVTGYYAPAADVTLVASLTAVAEPEEPVYYNVQVGSNTYSKLADSPVGLPAIYDGKAVTGWSTTSGTYTSVYYVNPADADENKTITLTPMYAGETYTINATLEGESSHASLSTPSRINDNFYITVFTDAGYQIESFSAKVGDTVLGINPVSTIDRHTVTFIVEVSVYGQVDVTFTIAENDVSENISVIVEAALDENRNEGAYITVEADSDGYLPRDGTVVVTYHYAYVSDSGRLTMGSSSTVQISLDNNGELTSQRVFVNLDDSSNYADDGQEQFVNGHAYAIVAVYSYGTESVISNTETPAYVNES